MPAGQPFTSLCTSLARRRSSGRADLHIHTTFSDGAYTPAHNGLYRVELTVRNDDGGVGTRAVEVSVEGEVPDAQIAIQTEGTEGATVHAQAVLSEVLSQDQLVFTWTATKNGVLYASSSGAGRPNFEFVPDDNGLYAVSLRVPNGITSKVAPTRTKLSICPKVSNEETGANSPPLSGMQ